jgi:uncharacterized metal-binding protein
MPSGRTHDRVTLWSLPWIVGGSFAITRNGELTLIVGSAFLFSGLMFGPDLDIYSVQYKRWGWLRWLWLPYQKTLRHRSQLSHGPIVGTTLRIAYLGGCLGLMGILGVAVGQSIGDFAWNWHAFAQQSVQWLGIYRREAIALVVGLELGAMSHALADWLGSTYRPLQKKRGKKGKRRKRGIGKPRE